MARKGSTRIGGTTSFVSKNKGKSSTYVGGAKKRSSKMAYGSKLKLRNY